MPIAKVNGKELSSLSLQSQNPLTKDGWVQYTFSNNEKLLYRNYKGAAVYEDVIYADTNNMPAYIKRIEDNLAGKNAINTQSIGLNPNGCSARFIFCTVYTSAYLWTGRQINYVYSGFTDDEINNTLEPQIRAWNNSGIVMKLNRIYSNANDAGPRVLIVATTDPAYCGQAPIGFQGKVAFTSGNYIRISRFNNNNCLQASSGTLLHEMGHVVGLPHEQTQFDRDKYVRIGQLPDQSVIRNGDDVKTYGYFDYNSIMLYDSQYVYAKAAQGKYQGVNPYDAKYNPTGYFTRASSLTPGDVITINSIYARIYLP